MKYAIYIAIALHFARKTVKKLFAGRKTSTTYRPLYRPPVNSMTGQAEVSIRTIFKDPDAPRCTVDKELWNRILEAGDKGRNASMCFDVTRALFQKRELVGVTPLINRRFPSEPMITAVQKEKPKIDGISSRYTGEVIRDGDGNERILGGGAGANYDCDFIMSAWT